MKNLFFLLLITSISFSSFAQKVEKVVVTTTASLDYATDRVKMAGKQRKYGSRDLVINASDAKVTLWQNVGNFAAFEIYCQVSLVVLDDTTILTFVLPHNPKAIANWTNELRKIVKRLELPDQVIGKYYAGIE